MSKNKAEEVSQIIEFEDDEPTELEYIQQLIEDFDLKRTDTIGDLLEALEDDENCEDEDNDANP